MASLSTAKNLGGVGGILAIIPGVSLIGWILILVALKEISDVTQDKAIFDDALIAGITAIVGAATLIAVLIFGFGGLFTLGFFGILAIFWVILIISSIFLKRAYDKVSQHLKVGSFATAGLLYLVGAITTIVFAGFIILFVALIFQIVAYFSIQDQPPILYPGYQPPQPMYPSTPSTQQTVSSPAQPVQTQPAPAPQPQAVSEFKYCFKCGTKLPANAVYCTTCGTKQL